MNHENRIDRKHLRRQDAMRFLFGRIDYERAIAVAYRPGEFKLDRMRQLLGRLENPQQGMPIVHVAGTKGKGSTAAMIAEVLSAAGYRTGVFSSPHLDRIEQRTAVNGRHCPADEFVELIEQLRPAVEAMDRAAAENGPDEIGPTYFELNTALALLHFARSKVDIAVLEVGLGGRLDSTNVCTPCVSVITSISFDHTRQLGNSLASIAREKAGIVKPGVPVVSGVTDNEPREVIRAVCRRRGCRLIEAGVDFAFDYRPPRHLERAPAAGKLDFSLLSAAVCIKDLSLGPLGRHQAANAAVALAVLAELQRQGWRIPEGAVRTGLSKVECAARVEVVSRRPAIVLDSAHNPASVEALLDVLQTSFSAERRVLIFAATQEKDLRGMLDRLLGAFDEVIVTCYLDNPRAVPAGESAAVARRLGDHEVTVCDRPADALSEAKRRAGPADLICITGSFFLAAEIRRRLAETGVIRHPRSSPHA